MLKLRQAQTSMWDYFLPDELLHLNEELASVDEMLDDEVYLWNRSSSVVSYGLGKSLSRGYRGVSTWVGFGILTYSLRRLAALK